MNQRLCKTLKRLMLAPSLWLAACTVGPDYHKPPVVTPVAWRNVDQDDWQKARPDHAPLTLDWWRGFQDPVLNDLEAKALASNQTLREAVAHYEAAQASLSITSAAALPEISINGGAARNKTSGDRPLQSYYTPVESTTQNDITLRTTLNYEVDLFGRIRREVEGARAAQTQAADDLANARLVLTADVATQYLALRQADDEIAILQRAVSLQKKAQNFVNTRHRLGVVSGLDVYQQKTQLDETETQAQLLLKQRAEYQDEIAVLLGVAASTFAVPAIDPQVLAGLTDSALQSSGPGQTQLPALNVDVPATLLQRRPDIASAERAMAQANARIGVAQSAWYPDLTLSPSIGWESTRFASMLTAPGLLWSLGASAAQVVFDGGKRRASLAFANQDYVAQEAAYRQTVLTAFQQVQDAVSGLRVLDQAAQKARAGVDDGHHLLSLANKRYAGGVAQFIDVITAEQQVLQVERQAIQIRGQQAAVSVYLAKALGGGWQDTMPAFTHASTSEKHAPTP